MVTTTVEIALASDGRHEVNIKKAFGSSAKETEQAEQLAKHYVRHVLPKKGNVSGRLTLIIEQNDDGGFAHSMKFTPIKQEDVEDLSEETTNTDPVAYGNQDHSIAEELRPDRHDARRQAGNHDSTTSGQPSVPDSVSPSAVADDAPILPCLRCAKRIVHNSKDKSTTKEEGMAPELDGTINVDAMRCKKEYGDMKCRCCKKKNSPCLEIPDRARVACEKVLRYAAAIQAGVLPLDSTKADALDAQALFSYIAALKGPTTKKRKEPSETDAEMTEFSG